MARPAADRGLDDQGTPLDPRVHVLNVPACPSSRSRWAAGSIAVCLWRSTWRELEQFAAAGRRCSASVGRSAWRWRRFASCGPPPASSMRWTISPSSIAGSPAARCAATKTPIADEVDLVVASSTFLADKFVRRGLRVEKVLNACEYRRGTNSDANTAFAHRIPASPVLGYLGCLGRWFDWPLVVRLAEAVPHARIELVGPLRRTAAGQPAGQRAAAARVQAVGGRRTLGSLLGRLDPVSERIPSDGRRRSDQVLRISRGRPARAQHAFWRDGAPRPRGWRVLPRSGQRPGDRCYDRPGPSPRRRLEIDQFRPRQRLECPFSSDYSSSDRCWPATVKETRGLSFCNGLHMGSLVLTSLVALGGVAVADGGGADACAAVGHRRSARRPAEAARPAHAALGRRGRLRRHGAGAAGRPLRPGRRQHRIHRTLHRLDHRRRLRLLRRQHRRPLRPARSR